MNAVFNAVGAEDVGLPTLTQDGQLRSGATMVEFASFIEHSTLPEKTSLNGPREPLHPEAQRSLIPSLDSSY